MQFKDLKNKKIFILGFGKEGQDTYLGLRKIFPNQEFAIADADKNKLNKISRSFREKIKKDKNLFFYFGPKFLSEINKFEVVIKTPGIPFSQVRGFLKNKNLKVTSQTEIFLKNCPGTVIGVTGTKGKGTTASLIYSIFKTAGFKVYLVGNIGKPVMQKLLVSKQNEIFVYELSSHQLQNLKESPQISIFLNLYPDHLDYYKNFAEYKKAKANITLHQTKNDVFIYNAEQKDIKEIAKRSKATKFPLTKRIAAGLIKNILRKNQLPPIFKSSEGSIDLAAAIKVANLFDISQQSIRTALKNFKFLPDRLEYIGEYKKINFYNDSLATVPQATELALETVKNVQTLILGGSKKGEIDFSNLVKTILKLKIKNIILFPETGFLIWKQIKNFSRGNYLPKIYFTDSMREAVQISYEKTKEGGSCLLSPASASFGLFKDYKDRGDKFKRYVKYYGQRRN